MVNRVAVFIDHTNVYKNLKNLSKIDSGWERKYDPQFLAQKLAGSRDLASTNFYCTRPPAIWSNGTPEEIYSYNTQMGYYASVEKLGINVKYGTLAGVPGNYREKNLDTKLSTDLLMMAVRNEYDTAVVVSNDGDYVDAVVEVTNLGRKVEVFYFKDGISMNLKRVADVARRARKVHFVGIK